MTVAMLSNFAPRAKVFHSDNAALLARLCCYSYMLDETLAREACARGTGALKTRFFAEGIVCRFHDWQAIAFRGSDSPGDWGGINARALLISPVPWNKDASGEWKAGGGHGGFLRCLEGAWKGMRSLLVPELPLWVTGHSLGGALALLALLRLSRDAGEIRLAGAVTLGSPRIGNATLLSQFPVSPAIFNVLHGGDPIPFLPPPLLGYAPLPGESFWVNDKIGLKGEIARQKHRDEYKNLSFAEALKDHSVEKYADALEALSRRKIWANFG